MKKVIVREMMAATHLIGEEVDLLESEDDIKDYFQGSNESVNFHLDNITSSVVLGFAVDPTLTSFEYSYAARLRMVVKYIDEIEEIN